MAHSFEVRILIWLVRPLWRPSAHLRTDERALRAVCLDSASPEAAFPACPHSLLEAHPLVRAVFIYTLLVEDLARLGRQYSSHVLTNVLSSRFWLY